VADALVGRRIVSATATGARSIRRHADAAEFTARVAGRRLCRVDRKGKYLLGRLDDGGVLVVHLGMSGQLRVAPADAAMAPHTHVVLSFEQGDQLRFVDPRTFGEVWATTPPAGEVAELAHLGVDAVDGLARWQDLASVLAGRRTRLKPLLMDQRVIAGIGNIYADEILFASRLHGDRTAGELTAPEVRRLHAAMTSILAAAIAAGGSSLADLQYRDVHGAVGGYQARHAVYGREGAPCLRCGRGTVVRAVSGGRSTFTCPRCQPVRGARRGRPAPLG
jgi:formamidopyrimidine-DNA glycosylase